MNTVAAFFDVDGTLVDANQISYYHFFLKGLFSGTKQYGKLASMILHLPYWGILDKVDRNLFNKSFFSVYRDISREAVSPLAQDCFEQMVEKRLISSVVSRVKEHRNRGDRIILLSGSLDFILEPLGKYLGAEAVLCSSLEEDHDHFTGKLASEPLIGENKARKVSDYARDHGIDLSKSYAYADDRSDLPLMNEIGHPVAVRPKFALRREALKRGWEILKG